MVHDLEHRALRRRPGHRQTVVRNVRYRRRRRLARRFVPPARPQQPAQQAVVESGGRHLVGRIRRVTRLNADRGKERNTNHKQCCKRPIHVMYQQFSFWVFALLFSRGFGSSGRFFVGVVGSGSRYQGGREAVPPVASRDRRAFQSGNTWYSVTVRRCSNSRRPGCRGGGPLCSRASHSAPRRKILNSEVALPALDNFSYRE